MIKQHTQQIVHWGKRMVWPITVVLAFVVGAMIFASDPRSHERTHGDHGKPSEIWTCPMHPQVKAHEPGPCPLCGMDLVPVTSPNSQNATESQLAPNQISLSKQARIKARIRTASVKRLHSGHVERRLLGRVDYDETRLATVTSWIDGRIDRLIVRTTGQAIKRGQAIASLYSPEVFSAHQDLLVAKRQVEILSAATEATQSGARATLSAARDRLRLLGVPKWELTAMEKAAKPWRRVRIRTPFAGTVIERIATQGNYVRAGAGLYKVADLSKLWVQLDAYESDLSVLKVGNEVSLKVEALPQEHFEGKIAFVDPVINTQTRTTRVRIEVDNTKGLLRPGMFAEAVVHSGQPQDETIVVPDTAPLFAGRRSIVYVELPDKETPTYEARVVSLGSKMGDQYPVISGLSEGERVVIHGAFVLDADLQIRGGESMMMDKTAPSPPPAAGGHKH